MDKAWHRSNSLRRDIYASNGNDSLMLKHVSKGVEWDDHVWSIFHSTIVFLLVFVCAGGFDHL